MSVKQAVGEGAARGVTEAIATGDLDKVKQLFSFLVGQGGGDTVLTRSGVTDDALFAIALKRYRDNGEENRRILDQLIKVLPAPQKAQFTTICNGIVVLPFLNVLGKEDQASPEKLDLRETTEIFNVLFAIWDQMVEEYNMGDQGAEQAVALLKKYGLFGDESIPKGLALLKRRVNSRGQAMLDGLGSIWAALGSNAEGNPGSLAQQAKAWREKMTANRPDSWGSKLDNRLFPEPPQEER